MALIKYVTPDKAEGKVKDAYSFFEKMKAPVPMPLQMMSASPELALMQSQGLKYYISHPNLSFPLLAHIRMLAAHAEHYDYCVQFNADMLQALAGLTKEQIEAAKSDAGQAVLEPRDKAMLLFVLKVIHDPASTIQQDVDGLRGQGWTDADIFDAVFHGVGMVSAGMAFKAFKMGE